MEIAFGVIFVMILLFWRLGLDLLDLQKGGNLHSESRLG